jgi:hypothetical protein
VAEVETLRRLAAELAQLLPRLARLDALRDDVEAEVAAEVEIARAFLVPEVEVRPIVEW